MECFRRAQEGLRRIRKRLSEDSFDNLVWLVSVGPSLVGYQITKKKIFVPFWVVHLFLLAYVYGAGSIVYQAKHAQVASDFIKSYVNVSILVLTANNSYWWITQRNLLRSVLKKAKESDTSSIEAGMFLDKHKRYLYNVKRILLVFYTINSTNEFTSYLPKRADLNEKTFSMTPCVAHLMKSGNYGGHYKAIKEITCALLTLRSKVECLYARIEPLTSSPQREICIVLASIQEISIMNVVHSFQSTMVLLIAHTCLMYQLLADETMTFKTLLTDPRNYDFVKERLAVIINRHALILDTTKDLRSLYSVPMGINFASNAVCMCFFFFLETREYFNFMPIVVYCSIVFFLYCFLGQKLTNAAEMFSQAVYSCGWEMLRVKERRVVFSMLLQSQKEVDLLAADLIPVNMRTFASTCQAIYKFATVFKLQVK